MFLWDRHVKELATELFLSNAVVSGHIRKLEEVGIVGSRMKRMDGGTYKVCFVKLEFLQIKLSPDAPAYLHKDQRLYEIEISLEIGSEAPRVNENWPSDIRFYLNEKLLGLWRSPGDFGKTRGRLTPEWWHSDVNQYGLLKVLRTKETGTYIDGQRISDIGLCDIETNAMNWTFRIAAEDTGRGRGGLTLYGKGFGNYNQDIIVRSFYIYR
ncbi:hypothetical protein HMSSN036_47640 [Paenibacillus macerans]|nr:hypothetical protein HMSSN036_47640 [Paenibacillus macerans]